MLESKLNWLFCTKFVQLAAAGKKAQHSCAPPKKSNKMDLTVAQYF